MVSLTIYWGDNTDSLKSMLPELGEWNVHPPPPPPPLPVHCG